MARRVNSLSSTPTAISREINSEYDSVKIVADNIEDIKAVAAKSDSYIGLVDSINAASSILITSVDYLEAVELEVAEIRDTVVTARDQAVISAANASTSEINTAASEANAALSEASAANSADSALASANTAITNASISTTQASVASLSANNALTSENNAAISAQEAAVSEANAATSETNAGISESNALTYATNADTSAVNASTSETNALASAVSATNSEANASVSEANAATSESNAEAHAIASAVSETNALASESAAALSETNASESEANALTYMDMAQEWAANPVDVTITGYAETYSAKHYATKAEAAVDTITTLSNATSASEAAAQASAEAAAISETNAASSEQNALQASTIAVAAKDTVLVSETNVTTLEDQVQSNTTLVQSLADQVAIDASDLDTAVVSAENNAIIATTQAGIATTAATTADVKAIEASTSASNAATSATNALTSANNAGVSETNASTSEINAASSEAAAALSESNAASSASSASASETSAATSATSAEASKDAALVAQLAAESSLDEFTDIYLGALATDPTTDNDGDPLTAGIFYYNTGDNTGLRVYSGTSWDPAVFRADGTVLSFNDRSGAVMLTNSDVTSATGQALDETGTPKFASIQITGGVNPNDGLMSWNSVDETIDLVTGLNTTYQLGQELGAVVRNLSGATIDNGTVVRVLGASGDKITVGIADNSTAITSDTSFAIVTETINNNSTGKVTTEGLVRGLDTSGFTEGDSLWLGTSGNYTNVHPISPVTTVHIGWVVRSHASDGSIYVKIDKVGNLNDSNDVLINSLQHGDFLGWDNASSLWKNITIDKSYIDSLGVDATTLDGFDSTFFEPADPDIVKDVNYVHTDNNFDDVYKSSVDRNTAVTGTSVLTRYDKLLNNLDVIDMIYDTGDLVTVRYQGDNNIDTFYRDVLNYTSGNLTSVYHFYNTSDLITTSATTVLGYTGNDLTSTTYTE